MPYATRSSESGVHRGRLKEESLLDRVNRHLQHSFPGRNFQQVTCSQRRDTIPVRRFCSEKEIFGTI